MKKCQLQEQKCGEKVVRGITHDDSFFPFFFHGTCARCLFLKDLSLDTFFLLFYFLFILSFGIFDKFWMYFMDRRIKRRWMEESRINFNVKVIWSHLE
jgi:hypothetical protein